MSMKLQNVTRDEVWAAVKEDLRSRRPDEKLTVEVKRYVQRRTLTQNGFFHLLCDHVGKRLGMDPALVKEGIKGKYGFYVDVFHQRVPKPSSQCNKLEEMSALIEGCFQEAGEQGLDMRDFINEWYRIKEAEIDTVRSV